MDPKSGCSEDMEVGDRPRYRALGTRQDESNLQKKDIDYFESFAPTASHITIRLVLAITDIPGFFSYDYDAVCAFISAPLPVSERVYVKAVPGYPLEDDDCLELHYTIYDLKQSPRAYYFLCQKVYTDIGLDQLKTDECCSILVKNNVKNGYKNSRKLQW